jgi:hypothetical protein
MKEWERSEIRRQEDSLNCILSFVVGLNLWEILYCISYVIECFVVSILIWEKFLDVVRKLSHMKVC